MQRRPPSQSLPAVVGGRGAHAEKREKKLFLRRDAAGDGALLAEVVACPSRCPRSGWPRGPHRVGGRPTHVDDARMPASRSLARSRSRSAPGAGGACTSRPARSHPSAAAARRCRRRRAVRRGRGLRAALLGPRGPGQRRGPPWAAPLRGTWRGLRPGAAGARRRGRRRRRAAAGGPAPPRLQRQRELQQQPAPGRRRSAEARSERAAGVEKGLCRVLREHYVLLHL